MIASFVQQLTDDRAIANSYHHTVYPYLSHRSNTKCVRTINPSVWYTMTSVSSSLTDYDTSTVIALVGKVLICQPHFLGTFLRNVENMVKFAVSVRKSISGKSPSFIGKGAYSRLTMKDYR